MSEHTDKFIAMVEGRKRIAVVGSRGFSDYGLFREKIDKITSNLPDVCFVSGGCPTGADSLIEMYAHDYGFPMLIFYPDYRRHDRRAPLERNKLIVENSEMLIAFWDSVSKGTAHTLKLAEAKGIPIRIIKI